MDTSSNEGDSFNWNTEDELEIDGISSSSTHQEQIADYAPALENSPEKEHGLDNPRHVEPQIHSQDVLSDEEIGENEESTNAFVGKDEIVSILVEMGYQAEEALDAIDKCGITNISCIDTTVEELSEFIVASQFASDDGDARCHQQQNLRVTFANLLLLGTWA
ncbi:hypothetical protein ACH5RR_035619 [Cinchona calisaya]|uniref:UBA domain-containing protein n=1 Tax=Cinchona calisaya TaxID=153742 RepID=A0ABD2Y314_9GENT